MPTCAGLVVPPSQRTHATPAGVVRFGNCGVGIFEGANLDKVNSEVAKTPRLHKPCELRFETTFTNVFNRASYASPQTNISYPNSGALNAVLPLGLGRNRTSQMARSMDF
jgi:hypothetical protein